MEHHDDCGEDLSTLEQESYFEEVRSSDSEPDLPAGLAQTLSGWCQQRAEIEEPPNLSANTFLARDAEEMLDILDHKTPLNWPRGELVEICGGHALTSQILIKRRLRAGHNFELLTIRQAQPDNQHCRRGRITAIRRTDRQILWGGLTAPTTSQQALCPRAAPRNHNV